jgi:hypothetical protein
MRACPPAVSSFPGSPRVSSSSRPSTCATTRWLRTCAAGQRRALGREVEARAPALASACPVALHSTMSLAPSCSRSRSSASTAAAGAGGPGRRRPRGSCWPGRRQGVERGAPQVEAGGQRRFHPHVEPAFDGARHELVGHGVDEQPGQHADQPMMAASLSSRRLPNLRAPEAQHQPHRQPHDDQRQQRRHRHVDRDQPAEVLLVERAVAGGQREQEQQHHAQPGHEHQASHHRPAASGAVCLGISRGSVFCACGPGGSASRGHRCPARRRGGVRPRCGGHLQSALHLDQSHRAGWPCRSGTGAAAATGRAGSAIRTGSSRPRPAAGSDQRQPATRLTAARASSRLSKFWCRAYCSRAGAGGPSVDRLTAPAPGQGLVGQAQGAVRAGHALVGPVPALAHHIGLPDKVQRHALEQGVFHRRSASRVSRTDSTGHRRCAAPLPGSTGSARCLRAGQAQQRQAANQCAPQACPAPAPRGRRRGPAAGQARALSMRA